MASSNIARQMNRSLETKLAIYENMAEHVHQRSVIFTSRAEIWSTDRNPVIITGLPFPSVSPSDNLKPGDLTRVMMEYYRNLPTVKEQGGHRTNLILFEFQVHGITEVHAVFSGRKSSAMEIPDKIYLKNLAPTKVISRQHSTDPNKEKTSRTSVSMVLAGETVARPASIGRDISRLSLRTTSEEDRAVGSIESRLGPELSENLGKKLKIPSDSLRSDLSMTSGSLVTGEHLSYSSPTKEGITSHSTRFNESRTSGSLVKGEYRCYLSPTKEGVSGSYKRHDVKVERSLSNVISSFEALSTGSVDEGDKYDYSLSFSSKFAAESEEYEKKCEKLRAITSRLSVDLMKNLFKKLRVYEERPPDAKHLAYIFTSDARLWKKYRDPKIEITELPPIPPEYDHERNDIIQDIVDYMRLSHMIMNWPNWEPIYVATLRIETALRTEVHIVLTPHPENASQYYLFTGLRPTLDPLSSRAHSLPVAAPRMGARSVRGLLKEDSLEDVPDLPTDFTPSPNPSE